MLHKLHYITLNYIRKGNSVYSVQHIELPLTGEGMYYAVHAKYSPKFT